MDKGDFIGRNALVDKDHCGLLYGLICHTETPSSGSIIVDSDWEISKITASVPSPTLRCGIGYAHFNSPGNWAGKVLTLRLTDGTDNACEIVDLPIFDPDKNIVRGIDRTLLE